MNALEIATELTAPIGTSGQSTYATCEQAAALLRRQHEAIVKLREALELIDDTCMGGSRVEMLCRNALKDTEGL